MAKNPKTAAYQGRPLIAMLLIKTQDDRDLAETFFYGIQATLGNDAVSTVSGSGWFYHKRPRRLLLFKSETGAQAYLQSKDAAQMPSVVMIADIEGATARAALNGDDALFADAALVPYFTGSITDEQRAASARIRQGINKSDEDATQMREAILAKLVKSAFWSDLMMGEWGGAQRDTHDPWLGNSGIIRAGEPRYI